jgi:hypothetical protein
MSRQPTQTAMITLVGGPTVLIVAGPLHSITVGGAPRPSLRVGESAFTPSLKAAHWWATWWPEPATT